MVDMPEQLSPPVTNFGLAKYRKQFLVVLDISVSQFKYLNTVQFELQG